VKCPYCQRSSKVVDSRPMPDGIRRRRQCEGCGRRFTTHERLAPVEVRVTKARDRPAEEFDPGKIVRAVERVGGGGVVGRREGVDVARRIEMELVDAGRTSVRSGQIAAMVHRLLEELDPEAARRFAADYTTADGIVVFDRGEVGKKRGRREGEEQIGLF